MEAHKSPCIEDSSHIRGPSPLPCSFGGVSWVCASISPENRFLLLRRSELLPVLHGTSHVLFLRLVCWIGWDMGGCQSHGPLLGPEYNAAPRIEGTQKGTIILRTTHIWYRTPERNVQLLWKVQAGILSSVSGFPNAAGQCGKTG